jgi:hypothetical protein
MQLGNRTTLTSIPRKTVDVEFPEHDCSYRLREMSGTERDHFEIAQFKSGAVDPLYLRARLVALCLVDEDGARIFADDEVHQLSDQVSASLIGKLFVAAQTLNGLDAGSLESAEKNSDSVPRDSSTSA